MAEEFTQANRRLQITTPLGPDAVLLTRLSGVEGISSLFTFEAELIGRDESLDFDSIVGERVTASILMSGGELRYVNGIVSRFAQSGTSGSHVAYHAVIVPWTWFLTRTSDCRIFQRKSVPDIVRGIFGEYGFTDFRFRLKGTYDQWDYCVQYRETDFNFIARLLEEEGIYFFFEHEDGKHTLILADSPDAHASCPGLSDVRFQHAVGHGVEDDVVTFLRKEQEIRASKYTATDYNMETPSLSLEASASGRDLQKYELYDYPVGSMKRDRSERLVRVRQQEEDTSRVVIGGASFCRSFTPGYSFTLTAVDPRRHGFDGKYVLTSVRHRAHESFGPETGDDDTSYDNEFECVPASIPYRPQRRTPRPVISGVQTAVVVGPSGEEIFVDKYGRVKVQFHWDREGKRDDNSSCWIRVSQGWAGKNWGMVTIPRIGQEVIVSFLEGDPDCPIITGRVYNAEQMPPYDLPANATQSGIKSRSSKSGSPANFNEIRFEDKKGDEEVYIHAEKNENHVVENDQTLYVGHDKFDKIDNDKTIEVTGKHQENIDKSMTIMVGTNRSITVGANLTETVALNCAQTIGVAMEITVGAAMALTVGGSKAETVGGGSIETVGGSKTFTVAKNHTEQVGKNRDVTIDKDLAEKVGGKHTEAVEKEYLLQAKTVQLVAKDEITLKTGQASITMKKNGDIEIKGQKINVKGSGDVVIKGSQIKEN